MLNACSSTRRASARILHLLKVSLFKFTASRASPTASPEFVNASFLSISVKQYERLVQPAAGASGLTGSLAGAAFTGAVKGGEAAAGLEAAVGLEAAAG